MAKALARFGHVIDYQTGSHIRLTTQRNGEHHVTVPAHNPMKIGTLSAILRDIAAHLSLNRDELLKALFD
ncbi:type II toxin-antitoxin system HicA family toxin [Leptolyngbya sp. FACHB-261]|uniref:type II toxin-antitoxin system HicA family toxin n=1 Tax=Leptolyngbya sp. FACHB-261 TaxID=2692806 RepID=UPI001F550BEF|nr:type II toxin-antitoxin system HicA family toxin [Leptolyngbya sp. FACHB-261]